MRRRNSQREMVASGRYALGELAQNSVDCSSLVNAGRAGPEQPKRFYRFALIDPVDQPFATFCYHYRTWDQLRELGLLADYYAESEVSDIPIIEPDDGGSGSEGGGKDHAKPGSNAVAEQEDTVKVHGGDISGHDRASEVATQRLGGGKACSPASLGSSDDSESKLSRRDSISSGTYVPRGAPSGVSTGSPQSLRCRDRLDTYRMSMPPSIKLDAPEAASRPLHLPQKHGLESSTAYRPHPAHPIAE